MNEVIAWVVFAGAWLLVAGPLYQGSVELGELDIDREGDEQRSAHAPACRRRARARRRPSLGMHGTSYASRAEALSFLDALATSLAIR
jgi:hypothetical protein